MAPVPAPEPPGGGLVEIGERRAGRGWAVAAGRAYDAGPPRRPRRGKAVREQSRRKEDVGQRRENPAKRACHPRSDAVWTRGSVMRGCDVRREQPGDQASGESGNPNVSSAAGRAAARSRSGAIDVSGPPYRPGSAGRAPRLEASRPRGRRRLGPAPVPPPRARPGAYHSWSRTSPTRRGAPRQRNHHENAEASASSSASARLSSRRAPSSMAAASWRMSRTRSAVPSSATTASMCPSRASQSASSTSSGRCARRGAAATGEREQHAVDRAALEEARRAAGSAASRRSRGRASSDAPRSPPSAGRARTKWSGEPVDERRRRRAQPVARAGARRPRDRAPRPGRAARRAAPPAARGALARARAATRPSPRSAPASSASIAAGGRRHSSRSRVRNEAAGSARA